MLAEPALAATDERWDNDTVAFLHLFDFGASLNHFADKLVADHVTSPHRGYLAVNEVEI